MRALLAAAFACLLLAASSGCGNEEGEAPGGPSGSSADLIPVEHRERVAEHFNRGVALMERYQGLEAAKEFEEVARLAPRWTTGRLNLGIAYLNAERKEYYQPCEDTLRRVRAEEPDLPHAPYSLAMLYQHLGRFEEARRLFEEVLALDPEDPDTHYQMGNLVMDEDPEAALRHFHATLAHLPHHQAALYKVFTLLRNEGRFDEALPYLERFKSIVEGGAGLESGMKYGEMGRYANVLRAFGDPSPEVQEDLPPPLVEVASSRGLAAPAQVRPGWPGADLQAGAAGFAPGVAVADVDGDGDLDLFLPAHGETGEGVLYRREADVYVPASGTGIDATGAVGGWFGDYDADGDPDLYLTCAGPNRLYRNEGGVFEDVTETTGTAGGDALSVGAAWSDVDHDGDLDLYVANFASRDEEGAWLRGAPNLLWRNDRDGTFTEVASEAGIDGGEAATTAILTVDVDQDGDRDLYVIDDGTPNRLYLNDRIGRYTDAAGRHPLFADEGPGLGALLGDVDLDGREDVVLLRGPEPPRLFRQVDLRVWEEDLAFGSVAAGLGGCVGGVLGDLDLDADLDLVLLDAEGPSGRQHRILMNDGTGGFAVRGVLGPVREVPRARGAVLADLDGDGSLDLLVAHAGEPPRLWRAPPPPGRHWLVVAPAEAVEDMLPLGIGLHAEVKTGRRVQGGATTSASGYLGNPPPLVHFGLGGRGKADYVRLTWPDGMLQSEMEVPADQVWRVQKVERKPSSCPVLFAWDGSRFAFVTDFLGVGGVGFFLEPGLYAPPDPTEDVRIPPDKVRPRGGRYLLRAAEPLEEVTYFDQVRLVVYDHPAAWEVHPDERFTGSAPFPTARPWAVAERIHPVAARDDRGRDVLDALLREDRRYVEPPLDKRFVGYARDHWVELDFGDRLEGLEPGARLVLFLHGWVEYTYSHVNYAAHQAGLSLQSPRIEVPDGDGGWRVAVPEAGFPAGLPRTMTLDVTALPLRGDARLRLRTNMEVFWDEAFLGVDVADERLRAHVLDPVVAELRYLGYPREYSPDGRNPTLYDYDRIDLGVPFRNLAGDFTRLGDVRALLAEVDDAFVIMARGEELALEFDAAALPPLPEGWTRTLVLRTNGYCKDMDLYTACPDTVGPLPFHAMENYPPHCDPPPDPERDALHARYNTRRILAR